MISFIKNTINNFTSPEWIGEKICGLTEGIADFVEETETVARKLSPRDFHKIESISREADRNISRQQQAAHETLSQVKSAIEAFGQGANACLQKTQGFLEGVDGFVEETGIFASELSEGDFSRIKGSRAYQAAIASTPGQFLTQGKFGHVVVQWGKMQLFMKGCQYGYQYFLAPSAEDSFDFVSTIKTMLVVAPVFFAVAAHMKIRLDTNHAPRETLYELGAGGVLVSCTLINPGFFGNAIAPFAAKYALERFQGSKAVFLDSYNLREASLPRDILFSMAADIVLPPVANIVPDVAGGMLRVIFPKTVVRGAKAVLYPIAFVPLNGVVRGSWSAYDFVNKTQNRTALLRSPAAQIENQAEEQITALIRKADSSVKGAGAYAVHLCMKGFKPFMELLETTESIRSAYVAFEQNPTPATEAALNGAIQQKLGNSCPVYAEMHSGLEPLIHEQLALWIPFAKQWVQEQAGFPVFRQEAYLEGMVRIFLTSYAPYLALSKPLIEPFTLTEETDFLQRSGQMLQKFVGHTCFSRLAPHCPSLLATFYQEKHWFYKASAPGVRPVDTSKAAGYHALAADFLRNPFVQMKKLGMEELQKIHPFLARFSSHAVHVGIKGLNPFFELLESSPAVMEAYGAFSRAFKNGSRIEQDLSVDVFNTAVHQKLGESVRGYATIQEMLEPTITEEVNKQINTYSRELTFLDGNDRLYFAAMARLFATSYIPFLIANPSLIKAITQQEETALFDRIGRAVGPLIEHTQFREKTAEYSAMIKRFIAGRFPQQPGATGSVVPAVYSTYRELGVSVLHQLLVLITILTYSAAKVVHQAVTAVRNSVRQRLVFDAREVEAPFIF